MKFVHEVSIEDCEQREVSISFADQTNETEGLDGSNDQLYSRLESIGLFLVSVFFGVIFFKGMKKLEESKKGSRR